MRLGFWASKGLLPVRAAWSRRNLWKPWAVKPGEARRMGFEDVRSRCRRRVSRVVW